MFVNGGNYLLSGRPYLIQGDNNRSISLTPAQTRDIFNHKGWHNIIGFHTRNIIHRGHGFIQKKALKQTDADGIYISPVIGSKKTGDFRSEIILKAYDILISDYVSKQWFKCHQTNLKHFINIGPLWSYLIIDSKNNITK